MEEDAGAVLAQVVPLLVSRLPLVEGATKLGALVPLPKITLFAVKVASPVPPDATASVADKDAADPVVFWLSVGKVQFVSVPLVGVPRIGVTSVGLVLSTLLPEPVEVVTPVPPEATASVPVWSLRVREETKTLASPAALQIQILPSVALTAISPATKPVGTVVAV